MHLFALSFRCIQLPLCAIFLFVLRSVSPLCAQDTSFPNFTYQAPENTVTKTRVLGRARGPKNARTPDILVLSPDHIASTFRERPVLFYYLSKPVNATLQFAITERSSFEPLIEQELRVEQEKGIQKIDLSKYKISLQESANYRWSVFYVLDPDNRSLDVFTSGFVKRIKPNPELEKELEKCSGDKARQAALLAKNGIWYDALELLSSAIEEGGKNTSRLKKVRADILKQSGLDLSKFNQLADATP